MLQSMRSAAKYIFWVIAITFVGGFLLAETSGLLGRSPVTAGTAVATVNGEDISYQTWTAAVQQRAQQQEQQIGRGLTLDERSRLEDEVFDELVQGLLLQQEYERRGIGVSSAEIIEAARYNPPPMILQAAELQTEGRFDLEKYQRYLNSPAARQQGLLVQLEGYYRSEIPRAKLFERVAGDVFITDSRLWQAYKDQHDSAQVSYVAFQPPSAPDSSIKVSDAEIRAYYEKNKQEFERPGRAVVSVVTIPRTVTAADSSAVRAKAVALREEILKGAKFEDVAQRESADSVSAAKGGSLGMTHRSQFVEPFAKAAMALKPGELSEPIQTEFGYHIVRLDEKKGDSISARHVLLRFQQSDSSALRTDRRADSLSNLAASADVASRFDSAAKTLGLQIERGTAIEGQPLTIGGRFVPSVSAWAFRGVRPGESSDLFDTEDAYTLARLDTLIEGGIPPLDAVKEEIRNRLSHERKLDALIARANDVARAAAGSSLEDAARARDLSVKQSPLFNRASFVPGLGRLNEAIGAAFSLPVGTVSAPIKTEDGVFVIRVDKRVEGNRAEWEKQKATQRDQMAQGLRQQRVRAYLDVLRRNADVKDHRKEIDLRARGMEVSS